MKRDLNQLFRDFIQECEFSRKLRAETLRGYNETYKIFIKMMPGTRLQDISSVLMTNFFEVLEKRERIVGHNIIKKGIKKSTIVAYRNKLNCFFEWLIRKEYLLKNPFASMEYPSVHYEDKKFLQKEEVEKIFAAVHLHYNNNLLILKRNVLLFHFLLFCGLRREELLNLKIRDMDLERRLVIIRAETSKSQKIRRIPLHSEIITRYKDYINERKQFTTEYLFVSSKRDNKLSFDGMKHIVSKLIFQSGIKFHLHQFRHTFAMNYLKQSDNIFKLKELLGHKDIKMTAVYLRQIPTDEMREEVENMSIDKLI